MMLMNPSSSSSSSVAVLLLLLSSAYTVASRSSPVDNDCGVYGWSVPEPPSGAKLLQVNAVIRHGDRTPWTGQYCWPSDSSVWDCNLNSAQIPMYSDDQYGNIIPRVYRKVFLSGDEVLNGNCSVGQLTTIGFFQHKINGASLRETYVDSGFLEKAITPSQIYIRSDDEPRTQQSAEALMLGMYPPEGSYTEVVELNTVDLTYDYITANPTLCPKFGEYQLEFKSSSVWKDHQNVTTAVLNAISDAINFTVGEDDLDHFSDCLRTHRCHHLAWPHGMTEKLYNESWQEFSWQIFNMFKYPTVPANAQVGIGFLLKEIWQNMNKSVQNEQIQKFLLYSGHDTTLIPILVALQVDTLLWPAYASMILLELYDQSGKYYVRVIYNGKVLSLPFCGSSTLCDFDTFSSYMQSVTPYDPALQCQVSSKWKWHY